MSIKYFLKGIKKIKNYILIVPIFLYIIIIYIYIYKNLNKLKDFIIHNLAYLLTKIKFKIKKQITIAK